MQEKGLVKVDGGSYLDSGVGHVDSKDRSNRILPSWRRTERGIVRSIVFDQAENRLHAQKALDLLVKLIKREIV
jgi:hypothetical protein